MNVNISIAPVWVAMEFSPVVDIIQIEGTVSQICYMWPSFYFMIKNGKLFVIVFLTVIFHKIRIKTYIKILRHRSLHMHVKNNL